MAHFSGIGVGRGFSSGINGFLIVPDGGTNLLVLRGGKGMRLGASDRRLSWKELSAKDLNSALQRYLDQFKLVDKTQMETAMKEIWAACDCGLKSGERVFEVRAKGGGLPYLEAASGKTKLRVDVAILKQKTHKVAFRMLCHPSGRDLNPATRFQPDDAATLVRNLNGVFLPQVNIRFEVADSKWTSTPALPQPVTEPAFRHHILPDKNGDAGLTVFLVGRWKSKDTDPNGSYFEADRAALVDDKPQHPPQVAADAFLVTLAHELTHYLQHRRNFPGSHHNRDRVLMSTGIQSLVIDKQLVSDLNAW